MGDSRAHGWLTGPNRPSYSILFLNCFDWAFSTLLASSTFTYIFLGGINPYCFWKMWLKHAPFSLYFWRFCVPKPSQLTFSQPSWNVSVSSKIAWSMLTIVDLGICNAYEAKLLFLCIFGGFVYLSNPSLHFPSHHDTEVFSTSPCLAS